MMPPADSSATPASPARRLNTVERVTRETSVRVTLDLDGEGRCDIQTGIGFLDHLLSALATHARFDLELRCTGDLWIDDHHSAEDCALTLGDAFLRCLGDKSGITRFGTAYAPLDEALARAVVDLSGRPSPHIDLGLRREAIGQLACENMTHVLASFAAAGKMALHVDVLRGENDHHRVEAAFKACALALRQAVAPQGGSAIPSTKGTLG